MTTKSNMRNGTLFPFFSDYSLNVQVYVCNPKRNKIITFICTNGAEIFIFCLWEIKTIASSLSLGLVLVESEQRGGQSLVVVLVVASRFERNVVVVVLLVASRLERNHPELQASVTELRASVTQALLVMVESSMVESSMVESSMESELPQVGEYHKCCKVLSLEALVEVDNWLIGQ